MPFDGRRCRKPPFWLLALVAAFLIGCVLVPVDEVRHGSPAALKFSAAHAPYAGGDVIFSHALHAHMLCDDCHRGTASEETTGIPAPRTTAAARMQREARGDGNPDVILPSMGLCLGCHDGVEVSNDCITCHLVNRRDRRPGFHDGIFPRRHGRMAEEEAYKCALCHVEAECKGCHMERKPLSHTPRFERSTHGRMVTHDRRSCATCHETAFCENCHSQPPPDHTVAFMRGGGHKQAALIRARSCNTCHRYQELCVECHG